MTDSPVAARTAPRSEGRRGWRGGGAGVRPTRNAALICTVVTVLAAIGIALGLLTGHPLWIIGFMLPAVGYEIYRTAGASTRWAAWAMLAILVALTVLVFVDVTIDLATIVGQEETYVGGYRVPLGDVELLGPVMLVAVAVILLTRTAGVYTRWLAVVIAVAALALVYVLNPEVFTELVGSTSQDVARSI